jgi:hypothetical protein
MSSIIHHSFLEFTLCLNSTLHVQGTKLLNLVWMVNATTPIIPHHICLYLQVDRHPISLRFDCQLSSSLRSATEDVCETGLGVQ